MTEQWIRRLRLDVAGTTIELTGAPDARDDHGLRVRFSIHDATTQSPRVAEIRITNLSDATAQKIKAQANGGKADLLAGYRASVGRIFTGDIKQVRIGRENPTDTYVDVFAATGDRAYNNAIVNKTLKAGSTGEDVYRECVKAMSQFGITQGQIPDSLKQLRYPTPVTLYGMARNHLRTLAHSAGATWNIRDNAVDIIEKDGAREGGITVLNSRTGLIGLPTQTNLGIVARCLINTRIGINSLVKIDQKSIQQAALNLTYGGAPLNSEPYLPSLAADGVYRVIALDHLGDTHDQPWYCELYCMARNGTVPEAQASLGRGGAAGTIAPNQAYIGAN